MEIKPGMYVRTRYGKIFDCYVSEQMGKPIYYPKSSKTNGYIDYEEVYNSSKDILDLIEEDDYVNGNRVVHIIPADVCGDEELTDREIYAIRKDGYIEHVHREDIKTILTKEQYNESCITIDML